MKNGFFKRRIILYELLGFALIIIIVWLDEIIDISSLILKCKPTPVNWAESLIESVLILILGVGTIFMTNRLLNKINTMEGLLNVCYMCKKIKNENEDWEQIETFVHNHTNVNFSHGLCPECYKKYYNKLVK